MRLFLLLMLLPVFSYSQIIETNETDKFDSILKVGTNMDTLTRSNDLRKVLLVKVWRMASLKTVKEFPEAVVGYFSIITNEVLSIDSKSALKVIFEDGSINEYKHAGDYEVMGTNELATIYFPLDEKLSTKKIKSIRFAYSPSGYYDYEISKPAIVRDMVTLVRQSN
jgi:hypothetical protein